ncbi:hypothetical protein MA16_Dca001336 [Dendrobium catenatum]|uniref:Uncharacterized protein n=1 Tax=Dendrobium catenatum TaxID=906689 RepID=A0A2I0WM42_9ASPA|nr:hypothetical protein MA16_Dca001336 [Dendrobium catenatum]
MGWPARRWWWSGRRLEGKREAWPAAMDDEAMVVCEFQVIPNGNDNAEYGENEGLEVMTVERKLLQVGDALKRDFV